MWAALRISPCNRIMPGPLIGGNRPRNADFGQPPAAMFERSPGMAPIAGIQQSIMARDDVALDVPAVKEELVGPQLPAAERRQSPSWAA